MFRLLKEKLVGMNFLNFWYIALALMEEFNKHIRSRQNSP